MSCDVVAVVIVKYPSYWFARLALNSADDGIPLVVVEAMFAITEEVARGTYRKESALFEVGTAEELTEHCIMLVEQAANEFADEHYRLNKHVHAYDYVISGLEQNSGLGLKFEDATYTAENGVKVWFQREEHPEQ